MHQIGVKVLTFVRPALTCALVGAVLLASGTAGAQQSPTRPGSGFGGLGDRLRQGIPGLNNNQGGGAGTGGGGLGEGGASAGGRTTGGEPAAVQTVGTTGGGGASVRVTAGGGTFEPAKLRPVDYPEIPLEDGEVMSIPGPMPVSQFVSLLADATGWNTITTPAAELIQLIFNVTNLTPKGMLAILRFHGIYYEYDADTDIIYFMTTHEYLEREYGGLLEERFTIQHASVSAVETVLTALLSPQGKITVDPRTSSIFVRDTEDNIAYMQRMVFELDVPIETRSYPLMHISAEILVDSVQSMLSENGEMNIDPRTNMVVVTDHPSRQARIAEMIDFLDQALITKSWTLNYSDPNVVAEQIEVLVPDEMGTISVDERINNVTVTAIASRIEEIDRLVSIWDVRRRQVIIDAYLVTASTGVARNLGINWAYFGESGEDPFGLQVGNADPGYNSPPQSGQRFSIGALPVPVPLLGDSGEVLQDVFGNDAIAGFTGNDLAVTLDLLETNGEATILAHPQVSVQDGEEAVFENTTSVPYSQSQDRFSSGFDSSFRSVSRIEFIDVGTILRVLPRISGEDTVLLDISAEDSSSVFIEVIGADQVNTVPQKTQNKVETQVLVENQSTIVIGGLRTSNFADDEDKVPLLGDIPLIGRLFKSTQKDHQQSELLIFLTPTIAEITTSPMTERLASVDENLATSLRKDKTPGLKRAMQSIEDPPREIMVSIGQTGAYFSEGKSTNLDALRKVFFEAEGDTPAVVVVREHPRAPKEAGLGLTEIALEAGLKVEFDDSIVPFVPAPVVVQSETTVTEAEQP